MKWLSRSLLPILFAISLTTFSATFLYVLLTKDDDDDAAAAAAIKSSRIEKAKCISIQVKIPKHVIPAIIGRSGSMIRNIQDKTNTCIRIVDEDSVKVPDRTCIIESDNMENINAADSIIKDIIEDHPIVDVHELCIAQRIWDRIVAKNMLIVDEIQSSSGANLMFGRPFRIDKTEVERRITITGDNNQIALALEKIHYLIKKEIETEAQLTHKNNKDIVGLAEIPLNDEIDVSDSDIKFSQISLSEEDDLMEVYVSAMETPNSFWIQVIDNGSDALSTLVSKMTEYYNVKENRESHTLEKIKIGQMVAAKFSRCAKWYRGKVILLENTQCKVYFVDYGYLEFVPIDDVLGLRMDMLSLRLQATECSLANVKPIEGEWNTQSCEKFSELVCLTRRKILLAKIKGYKKRPFIFGAPCHEDLSIPCIDLYDNSYNQSINVGEFLVHHGLAQFEEKSVNYILPPCKKFFHSPFASSSRKILLVKKHPNGSN